MATYNVSKMAVQRWRCYSSSCRGVYVVAMARPFRPEMDDVDRLSKGGAAKRRGTGSFHIPHRLNSDERPVYEAAKKKGFLQVRGTGYRKGRKGHPLPNIYRQWCDAKEQPCIIIEQDMTGSNRDVVVVDLAPLRSSSLSSAVQCSLSLAHAAGARRIDPAERPLHAVPFDTMPVDLPMAVEQLLSGDAGAATAAAEAAKAAPTPEQIAAAEGLVAQQADAVRQLKGLGLGNAHPEVQSQVQVLIKLKADLQQLLDKAAAAERSMAASSANSCTSAASSNSSSTCSQTSSNASITAQSSGLHHANSEEAASSQQTSAQTTGSARQILDSDHPFATVAIWQLPVMPLFFEADRSAAKELAKQLMSALKV